MYLEDKLASQHLSIYRSTKLKALGPLYKAVSFSVNDARRRIVMITSVRSAETASQPDSSSLKSLSYDQRQQPEEW